jgi:hypothetical protein
MSLPHAKTALVVAVVVIGAVAALARAGGTSSSNRQFISDANAICRSDLPALESTSDPVQISQAAERLLSDLRALGNPAQGADLWQQWLDGEQQAAMLLGEGQIQAAASQAGELAPLARRLGLVACA